MTYVVILSKIWRHLGRIRELPWAAGVGVGSLALAVVVFFYGDGIMKDDPRPSIQVSPSFAVQLPSPSPSLARWKNWISVDGTTPTETDPYELLGISIGASPEKLLAFFGPADFKDGKFLRWNSDSLGVEGLSVSADRGAGDSVSQISVEIDDAVPDLRVALPYGLVLGRSTVQEAIDTLGEPSYTRLFSAENDSYYELYFNDGSESSRQINIQYFVHGGSKGDPGGFNQKLRSTEFNIFQFTNEGPEVESADSETHPFIRGWPSS